MKKTSKKLNQPLKSAPTRSRLDLQVLEPRVLLDAAAAKTVQEVAQPPGATPPSADAPDHHADLVDALATVQQGLDKAASAVPPAATAPATAEPARTEVYFIDRSVADADLLAQGLPADSEVHFIDSQVDGVEFIAQTLQGRSDIGAIHILGHGEAGALQLGIASLTVESMQGDYRDDLAAIGRALTVDGDILVYGCDFGQGATGASAAQTLSSLTGADVAASTDDTGAASQGGNWVLERQVGTVEAAAVSAQAWDHLLVAPVLDTTQALTYTAVEDAGAPVPGSAVGVLVSDYTVGMTDADPGAVKGIAIVGATTTNGTWWYSTDGGATWAQVGTVSTSSALLLADNASTRLYYQSNANFSGSAGNALTIRAWDQSAGTAGTKVSPTTITGAVSTASDSVTVTVTAVNDAPVLVAGTRNLTAISEDINAATPAPAPTGAVGTAVTTFIGSITDADTGSVRGIAIVGADAANGTWWYSANNGSTWTQLGAVSDATAVLLASSASSRVYFQPAADFNGTATITIRAWDQTSGTNGGVADASSNGGSSAFSSETALATITVNAVVDIRADTLSGANAAVEDTPKVFNPITGVGGGTADLFEGPNPQITAIAGQAIAPGGSVAVTNGTVSLAADGQTLTFLGAADFSGTVTFSYTVTSGGVSETANISVTVTAVGDAPQLDLDSSTAGVNSTASIDQGDAPIAPLATIIDPDGDNLSSLTVTLSNATAADSLRLGTTVPGITASYNSATGVLTLTGNGTLANYQDALRAVLFTTTSSSTEARTITVQATSGTSPNASNVAVATITPMDSDGDGVANAGDIDDDNDGILDTVEGGEDFAYATYTNISAREVTGTVGGVGFTITSTQNISTTNGVYGWGLFPSQYGVPNENPTIANAFASTWTITFDRPVENPIVVLASIGNPNVSVPVQFSTSIEVLFSRGVVINSATQITGAEGYAVVRLNGSDSFVVTVRDNFGGSAQSLVTMTVTPVQDAVDDTITTREDTPVTIDVNANDSFENAGHRLTSINGATIAVGDRVAVANGTVTLNGDGTLDFAPAPDFNGTTSFSYTVSSGGVTETATVTVNVVGTNDPPVPANPGGGEEPGVPGQTFDPDAGNYHITTPQDVPFSGRVAGADPDGDALTYTVATNPSNGSVVLNPDGSYTYTPNAKYVGNDSFVVYISDGNGGVVSSTVYITVTPLAQAARDDFPFVFYPQDDEVFRDDQANRWAGAHIDVEPTVIQAVNFAQWLHGTRELTPASGVVLRAVNGVKSLDGTTSLAADGAVLQAVNALDSLNGTASYDRLGSPADRVASLGDGAGSAQAHVVSSLSTNGGLTLELSGDRQQIWVSVGSSGGLRDFRATLADGRPVPDWVHVDRGGFLTMDRPAQVETLRLRLTVVPEKGAARASVIEFDFNSGQMRAIGGREAERPTRAPASPRADVQVPDFAAQLDVATRRQSSADAQLLELLS